MNREMFETCLEELASVLHTELLLGNGVANFLNVSIAVLNRYRTEPVGLDELETLEEAVGDAARRIQFGFSNPNCNPIRRHIYIRDQLTYAFTSSDERRELFGNDIQRGVLYVIEEE